MHYGNPASAQPAPQRSRRWLYLALGIVIAIAGWTAFWFYAAERANQAIAGWLEREARLGRVYSCDGQSLGGFPFRIEVRCKRAGVELRNMQPPLAVRMGDVLVAGKRQGNVEIGEGPKLVRQEGMARDLGNRRNEAVVQVGDARFGGCRAHLPAHLRSKLRPRRRLFPLVRFVRANVAARAAAGGQHRHEAEQGGQKAIHIQTISWPGCAARGRIRPSAPVPIRRPDCRRLRNGLD